MVEGSRRRGPHPLLVRRSHRSSYTHGLSESEMRVLSSICGALAPSLDPDGGQIPHLQNEAVERFYAAAASEIPIPDEVATMITKRATPQVVLLVRWVLWILSTRLGTLILCKSACFTRKLPFIRSFPEMAEREREEILQKWTREKLIPLRVVFATLKLFVWFIFMSPINGGFETRAWDAIGYHVDPQQPVDEKQEDRPLEEGLIEALYETEMSLPESLARKGLKVREDAAEAVYHVECDVVVIGSGSGGGVAAGILAAAGQKVLVLEKGNYFTARDYSGEEIPSLDQMYESGGILATADGKVAILAGSTVGGGTAVNWSASIRTPKSVLKEWASTQGLPLFLSTEYDSAMDAVWWRLGVTDNCVEESFQNQVLRKGCRNLGIRVESVPRNTSERHYCGSCSFGCRMGEKRGTDRTWLVDAVRAGAVILTSCRAERVELVDSDGGKKKMKCVGVVARILNDGIRNHLRITAKVTISSCGSLLTPPLLMSSGLKNVNIGRNLHLHPVQLAWGYFPESIADVKGKSFEGGIITCLHKLEDGHPVIIETPAVGPALFSSLFPWISGADMKTRMLKFGRTANLFALVRDAGSGEITADGRVKYQLEKVDRENLTRGLRAALRILVAAGATEVGTIRSDGQRLDCRGITEAALDEFLSQVNAVGGPRSSDEYWTVYCSAHQIGSCRMGATQEAGAVDENGESWEAENLYVCDASVLPSAVGINPMITIQATSHCISTRLAESLKSW